jgi:hypothetical protein
LWKAENNPLPCRLMLTYKFWVAECYKQQFLAYCFRKDYV